MPSDDRSQRPSRIAVRSTPYALPFTVGSGFLILGAVGALAHVERVPDAP